VPTTELSVLVRDKLVPILTGEALSRVRKQAQLSSLYSVVLDDPLAAEGMPECNKLYRVINPNNHHHNYNYNYNAHTIQPSPVVKLLTPIMLMLTLMLVQVPS
jgi:hypothetical protein